MISTHSPLYRKAFEQYLRKGTPIDISMKAMLLKAETSENHSTHLYIWRTAGDEKVRPSHAANEGRIFAWGNPPSTGHPGDEVNCRCTAEPVEVDTTPLEVLALLSGAGIVRRVGVRVGSAAILRRIRRNREEPPAQKPTRSIEDRPKNIPKDWVKSTSNNGKGVRYRDPNNKHNEVRVQRGEPNSSQPGQRQDYVTWKRNGQWLDKNGNRVPRQSLESHIPIDEFKFRPELFK